MAVDPTGVVTGFGFCAASTADQQAAETFFAVRHRPNPRLASVGSAFSSGPYVADKGFEGEENHRRWLERYGARVAHPPKRNSRKPWPKRLRRWLAGIRQVVEWNYNGLVDTFSLRHRHLLHTETLEALRTHVAERGMKPPSVVEGFQVLEDGTPCGLPGREAPTMDELAFERGYERF